VNVVEPDAGQTGHPDLWWAGRCLAEQTRRRTFGDDGAAVGAAGPYPVCADCAGGCRRWIYRGAATNKAGRRAIVMSTSTDSGETCDLAVFDPVYGTLLSYERVTPLRVGHSAARPPAMVSSVLFLVDQPDQLRWQPDQ
jgi:hypothetical protein